MYIAMSSEMARQVAVGCCLSRSCYGEGVYVGTSVPVKKTHDDAVRAHEWAFGTRPDYVLSFHMALERFCSLVQSGEIKPAEHVNGYRLHMDVLLHRDCVSWELIAVDRFRSGFEPYAEIS